MTDSKKTRLVSYISGAGIASRRKSFELIMSGKVTVNGNIVTEPSSFINDGDIIKFNGKEVKLSEYVYIMLNKPRGYTCTSNDPHADKKAIDLINIPGVRLFSIGRLDKDSEGLLLFTNDGQFANSVAHPKNRILKIYEVYLNNELKPDEIARMSKGISDEGEILKAESIKKIGVKTYLFTLGEGKKREIRRLVKCSGAAVTRLKRISIGPLKLDSLAPGKWRNLSTAEIKVLNSQ